MKQLILLFSLCILLLVSKSTIAQVAADYYLPMRVGNYLEFDTPDNLLSWGARTTRYTIEQSDPISGILYFKESGTEVMKNTPLETSVFRVLWLRKDSDGNILAGASGMVSWVINPPIFLFLNQFLVPNYSREYSDVNYNGEEKTLSINETVTVPAGTFTNCLKISDIHRDKNTGVINFLENKYYARGIGIVKSVREIPANQAHTAQLVKYNTLAPTNVLNESEVPASFSLLQNYPNPFNPSTNISFSLLSRSLVTLKVFDLLGREVATIISDELPTGNYTRQWNAANIPSGVYFYRLQAGSFIETKKLVLLR